MGSCDTRIATGGIQYQRALNIPLAMSSIMSLGVVNDQRFDVFDLKKFDPSNVLMSEVPVHCCKPVEGYQPRKHTD